MKNLQIPAEQKLQIKKICFSQICNSAQIGDRQFFLNVKSSITRFEIFAAFGFTMPACKPFECNSFTIIPKGESNGWTGGGADTRKR